MKRAIIFSSATAAGLAGVLAFHTAPVSLAVGGLGSSAGASTKVGGSSSTSTSSPPPTTTPSTTVPSTTAPKKPAKKPSTTSSTRPPSTTTSTTAPHATTTTSTGSRTATGELVNYYFGVLSVTVTATGKKIDSVKIGQISDSGNYRSQQIDQMSIPVLAQETVQAQNSQIQSVSGASYTSAGFVMSLQSALKKLGI